MVGGNMKKLLILTTFISLVFILVSYGADLESIYGYGDFSNLNSVTYDNSMILNSTALMKRNSRFFISFGVNVTSVNENRTVKLFDSYDNYLADYPVYEATYPYYNVQNVQIGYQHKYFALGLFYAPFSDNNYNSDYIEHDNYYVKTGEIRNYLIDNTNRLGFVLGVKPIKWVSITGSYQNIQGYVNKKYQHLFVDPTADDTTIVDKSTYSGNMWNAGLKLIPNNFIDISLFTEFPSNIRVEDDKTIDTLLTTQVNIIKYPYILGGEVKFKLPNRLPATIILDGNYSLWHNMQITDHTMGDSVYNDSTLNNAIFLRLVVKHKLSKNQCISFGASIQQSYIIQDLMIPTYIFGYTYISDNTFKLSGIISYSNYSFTNNEVNVNMPLSTTFNFSDFNFHFTASKCFDF